MAPPRNRRPGFSRRAQYSLFLAYVGLVGGALIGAALLLLSTFQPAAYGAVRGFFAEITTPISSGLTWVRDGIMSVPTTISNNWNVSSENVRLRKQIKDDEALVMRARTLNQENRRLREMVKLRDANTEAVVAARLVNSSAMSTRRYATLNAGSWQGVKHGMPVREPDGLVGQVLETSPNTARVLLVVDPESVIPVRRTRDGLPAIAAGRGDGLLDIRSASIAGVPLMAGDVFVTSGTGGVFPPNIPVARVMQSARDTAIAQPTANPDTLDFALVLQSFLPPPPPPAEAKPGDAKK